MPKLWNAIDGEPWLDNPKRRRRHKGKGRKRVRHRARARSKARTRRRPPAGFKSWKSYMAHIRGKRKGASVARSRKGRRHRGRARRHRFGSNPPRFTRGLTGRIMDGLKGGAGVVVGEALAGMVPRLIPVAALQSGIGNAAAQALTGVFLAPIIGRFAKSSEIAKAVLWGAFARPLRTLAVSSGFPILAPALSAYPGNLAALPTPGQASALSSYEYEDEMVM